LQLSKIFLKFAAKLRISYAEQFISGWLVYQRFSPQEQHGCAAGGAANVIASLLTGAEVGSDNQNPSALNDYQRVC
jgi:hypothetical protein